MADIERLRDAVEKAIQKQNWLAAANSDSVYRSYVMEGKHSALSAVLSALDGDWEELEGLSQ